MVMPACDRGDDKFLRSRDNIELNSRVCTTAGDAKRHTDDLKGCYAGSHQSIVTQVPAICMQTQLVERKGFQLSHIFVEMLR